MGSPRAGRGGAEFRLARRHDGNEIELAWQEEAAGTFVALDEGVVLRGGGSFEYLLYGRDSGEMWQLLERRSIDVVPVPKIAFGRASPNPFRLETSLRFHLAEAGPVHLTVHDARGAKVTTLVTGHQETGEHRLSWNGLDDAGDEAGSGLYFVVLEAHGERRSQKLILVR